MVFGLETKVKTKPLTNIVSCVMYWTSHLVVTGNITPQVISGFSGILVAQH
jgi:hypothetical protein